MAESHGTRQIRCLVVTPERTVVDVTTSFVAFPAYDGEVGVLPGRAPLIARLGSGELRLGSSDHGRSGGGKEVRYFVDGGFAQVSNDVVTLLTARAISKGELDAPQLEAQLGRIQAEVPHSDEGIAAKLDRQARVRAQLHLARS